MPATQEQRDGTIKLINADDTGVLIDDLSREEFEFFKQGAHVEFVQGDLVTFLKVVLPSGRVIVDKPVKKPH